MDEVFIPRDLLELMLKRLDQIADPNDTLESTYFVLDGVKLVPVEERSE